MIEYIIPGAVGALIAYFAINFDVKRQLEKASKKHTYLSVMGKRYFLMTQDQIQKAVKAVYLLEANELKQSENSFGVN